MKVKLLNKENVKELKDKEILIFFSSDLGAMGCPSCTDHLTAHALMTWLNGH